MVNCNISFIGKVIIWGNAYGNQLHTHRMPWKIWKNSTNDMQANPKIEVVFFFHLDPKCWKMIIGNWKISMTLRMVQWTNLCIFLGWQWTKSIFWFLNFLSSNLTYHLLFTIISNDTKDEIDVSKIIEFLLNFHVKKIIKETRCNCSHYDQIV
jgi:hypothetical protein